MTEGAANDIVVLARAMGVCVSELRRAGERMTSTRGRLMQTNLFAEVGALALRTVEAAEAERRRSEQPP